MRSLDETGEHSHGTQANQDASDPDTCSDFVQQEIAGGLQE
jgi:hypothetical protein